MTKFWITIFWIGIITVFVLAGIGVYSFRNVEDEGLGSAYVDDNCIKSLNSVSSTTTGQWIPVNDATRISVYLERDQHDAGTASFTVDVSPNASDTDVYERLLLNQDSTDSDNNDKVSSITFTGEDLQFYSFSAEDVPNYVRINTVIDDDGISNGWVCPQHDN